jgi:hypothetical protein
MPKFCPNIFEMTSQILIHNAVECIRFQTVNCLAMFTASPHVSLHAILSRISNMHCFTQLSLLRSHIGDTWSGVRGCGDTKNHPTREVTHGSVCNPAKR